MREPGGTRPSRSQNWDWLVTWVYSRASLVAYMVKNLPAVQVTWVPSLGGEDPLETGMAAHSSILAWRIPWTEELGGLQSMGLQRVRHNWTNTFTFRQKSMQRGPQTPKPVLFNSVSKFLWNEVFSKSPIFLINLFHTFHEFNWTLLF